MATGRDLAMDLAITALLLYAKRNYNLQRISFLFSLQNSVTNLALDTVGFLLPLLPTLPVERKSLAQRPQAQLKSSLVWSLHAIFCNIIRPLPLKFLTE